MTIEPWMLIGLVLITVGLSQGLNLVSFVVFFRYGSSAGSRAKDAVIAGQLTPPVTAPPPVPPPPPVQPPPVTVPTNPTKTIVGKVSYFGGPQDTGVSSSEGLALVERSEMSHFPGCFLAEQPPGTTGLARMLDPNASYCACRWDYKETPRIFLQTVMVQVTNKAGKSVMVRPVDWGPNANTGRVIDVSPGVMAALGLKTDDTVTVTIPLPAGEPQTSTSPPATASEPPWLSAARAEIGFHETGDNMGIGKYVTLAGYGAEGDPWCAIFAGAMLRKAGIPIPGINAMAQSFASSPGFTKIDTPRLGAIAVFWRGTRSSGTGHVGFYVGDAGNGRINVLGGNENDQVEIEALPVNGSTMGLLGYWWPANATTEPKVT